MTPSMMLFFSLAVLISVLSALVVIVPWLVKSKTANDNQLMAINVKVFGERISELEADHQAGRIDEKTFIAQQTELKRQLLDAQTHLETYVVAGQKSRLIVVVWVLILAGLAYLMVDDRTSVFRLWQAQDTVGQVADDLLTGKIDTPPQWAIADSTASTVLISVMQANVHAHAYDSQRWLRLSELFMALEATPQALEALARAYRLDPNNDDVAMLYAQTSFFANNGRLDATARTVLLGLLQRSPEHEGAMMMMAMGETRANNFASAKAWVAKLRSSIASKSGDRSTALASLDDLMANIESQEAKLTAGVNISVRIADSILPQIGDTDVVFVSIGDASGGAPYAVKRLPVSEFKNGVLTVQLSDLDAMMPERTLTAGRESGATLMVNAKISSQGVANTSSGDMTATPVVLADKTSVNLIISQIVP